MKQKIIVGVVAVIELVTFRFWLGCKDIRDMMNLSSVNIKLQLEDYIHTDTQSSLLSVRFFHNKITGLVVNTLDKYLKYFDIRFVSNSLSIIGVFGLILGVWYLLTRNTKVLYKVFILLLLFLWPLPYVFNLIHLPFLYKFLLLNLPYYAVSLYGVLSFLQRAQSRYRILFVLLLCLISIWWLVILPTEVTYFCVR